jgi:hypothetical protein
VDSSERYAGKKVQFSCDVARLIKQGLNLTQSIRQSAVRNQLSERAGWSWWRSDQRFEHSLRGQHPKVRWLLDDVKYQTAARQWVHDNCNRKGRPNMKAHDFAVWLSNDLLSGELDEGQEISAETARGWLHKLGFRPWRVGKAVYYDGHERPDGTWEGQPQCMQTAEGVAKGAKQIAMERGLYVNGDTLKDLKRKLAVCPDFRAARCLVEDLLAEQGVECWFSPRFHPELSPIEFVWSQMKLYARQHCGDTKIALRAALLAAADLVTAQSLLPLVSHCFELARAYSTGVTLGGAAEGLQKQYKSHRRVFLSSLAAQTPAQAAQSLQDAEAVCTAADKAAKEKADQESSSSAAEAEGGLSEEDGPEEVDILDEEEAEAAADALAEMYADSVEDALDD